MAEENKKEKGCIYATSTEATDAICKHLANIVTDRDNTMIEQNRIQNEKIDKHNAKVIDMLTDLQDGMSAQKVTFEKEIGDMKTDITWLKQRSSKSTIRKRIALAVFIAVAVSSVLIAVLSWLGKI
jgi:hypothetical protein